SGERRRLCCSGEVPNNGLELNGYVCSPSDQPSLELAVCSPLRILGISYRVGSASIHAGCVLRPGRGAVPSSQSSHRIR
uniref:Uncharacterized protein n=1 Tax=Aegilops tauschii subsp. strangulata TaxID=200361 RepID=A0A453S3W9_AEGTS